MSRRDEHCHCNRELGLCQHYLFSSTWLPLEDSLCCLIVLVGHSTGKRGHPLTVADVQTNVWMGDEELYDDVVLAANGSMDGSSALCILAEMKKKNPEIKACLELT